MTYWGYHLIFTLPLIIFLAFRLRQQISRAHIACWALVCFIAFAFTTPWDNYAVAIGIWGFGENVSLGYPFSEYKKSLSTLYCPLCFLKESSKILY